MGAGPGPPGKASYLVGLKGWDLQRVRARWLRPKAAGESCDCRVWMTGLMGHRLHMRAPVGF